MYRGKVSSVGRAAPGPGLPGASAIRRGVDEVDAARQKCTKEAWYGSRMDYCVIHGKKARQNFSVSMPARCTRAWKSWESKDP